MYVIARLSDRGKNIYPGCGAVRAGDIKYLEAQHFTPTVSIARSLR